MEKDDLNDVHVDSEVVLIPPAEFKRQHPMTKSAYRTIQRGRRTVEAILSRTDPRLLVIAGPCSIHDIEAAKVYAQRLKKLHDACKDTLYIVMRVYFEKPRTTVGWKGMINDPLMDDSFQIQEGLSRARDLLLWLAELGIPTATEALDPITPQYLCDMFAWSAIGARTTESQTHRELASGLSMPVGFKNGTDGSLSTAVNAMLSAARSHRFLGVNQEGKIVVVKTAGNQYGHLILRGSEKDSNYDEMHIDITEQVLHQHKLAANIMIDCSHGNSNKRPELQPVVVENLVQQILNGNESIIGFMLESHLNAGNQKIPSDLSELKYGVSVTDACIDWETCEQLLRHVRQELKDKLIERHA